MHKNNKHKAGYNFSRLKKSYPKLIDFVIKNPFNNQDTIDFSQSVAVKALNLALLKSDYNIDSWDIPDGYLCPPIPGRVDYIHHLHDLLMATPEDVLPKASKIKVLDIGTGASCIYPILGQRVYGWQFTASDIDPVSVKQAQRNLIENSGLANNVECRLQSDSSKIFTNIINANEFYHLTICNPPFHQSLAQASAGSMKKMQNLNDNKKNRKQSKQALLSSKNTLTKDSALKGSSFKNNTPTLNFGGQKAELWCEGGELAFIRNMINDSKKFKQQVLWFSCLVSKKDHVSLLKLSLKKAKVSDIKVIKMAQGQKISRFIAWSFHPKLSTNIISGVKPTAKAKVKSKAKLKSNSKNKSTSEQK